MYPPILFNHMVPVDLLNCGRMPLSQLLPVMSSRSWVGSKGVTTRRAFIMGNVPGAVMVNASQWWLLQ